MPEGPYGGPRATTRGPFSYDPEQPPKVPTSFEPPTITDHLGNEDYWEQWTDPTFARVNPEIPASLKGVTGVYIPSEDWVVVDDRVRIHHSVQFRESKKPDADIPSLVENDIIPFATDYVGSKGENVVGLNIDSLDEVDYWEGYASLPETGSLLIVDYEDSTFRAPTVADIYKMIYPIRVLGVEGLSLAQVEHKLRRAFTAERSVYLEQLYNELRFEEMLPEPKVKREFDIQRPER